MASEDVESTILHYLNTATIEDTLLWSEEKKLDHASVMSSCQSLEVEGYVAVTKLLKEFWKLSPEAEGYILQGSPEVQLFKAIPDNGIDEKGIESFFPKEFLAIAKGKAMQKKLISKDKASGLYMKLVPSITKDDLVEELLLVTNASAVNVDERLVKDLAKRQLIEKVKSISLKVEKGKSFALERKKVAADLTKELLDSGEYKVVNFKAINLESIGSDVGGGHLHVLMKVREEFRQNLLELGFSEMPTNRFVESSFWNFDALFQPQSHPSRDMHDTFFISKPAKTLAIPEDYLEKVKKMHEVGGFGSSGYRYDWKRLEAEKNLLRTHTTAISTRMLYLLGKNPNGFTPAKYFSIDRVFRNESLDATHLAEFHQVEGVVADYDLSLGDLIGLITEFFKRIGITQLRFKPAFNPYTEPSMEVFGYHPDLKKWTEIGNSGVFRPEMLRPMGLPENVRVIAWGLSLERPTMIKYRIKNIRELFGHKVKLDMSRNAPMCRFDKKE
jgi:phenylalanyl-tRNA synthetase alpha chain